jgi:preprotein translocase subunit SecD
VTNTDSADLGAVAQAFFAYSCDSPTGASPTKGNDDPTHYIVACSKDKSVKYLLGKAGVEGTEIGSADATINTQTNEWLVQLHWKGKGQDDWFNLTKKAYEADPQAQNKQCTPPTGCNAIAVVLDGVVQSAPVSQQDGIAGDTQISGNFSQSEATTLANVLKYGALPLKLEKLDTSTVSATLGSAQLRGGLIAGIIGLGLVILYSLLYYRALGVVTVASLALSGAILYAVTTLLGHSSLGYTLSLPGIAGFIVAVGITADSFVVYFERIRDEVREGKRLRSAVERAWPRARRTIISADAVSLLAAVVLYLASIGDVRGFAFTLGLSTLSDLFIVFFFTKPFLAVIARRPAFDAGKAWTGIGRARSGAILEPREA